MSLIKLGGQGDKSLVILHATGFLSAAYQPLADALSQHFVVWGLDLPGHGTAADMPLPRIPSSGTSSSNGGNSSSSSSRSSAGDSAAPCTTQDSSSSTSTPLSLSGVTQCVVDTLQGAGLKGCYAFGHSAGGAFALLAASQAPDLFKALFCFEAVVTTPATHAFLESAFASKQVSMDGQRLGAMARKRRAVFDSRRSALQQLRAKPPFLLMDPRAASLYVQHGFVAQSDAASGPLQQPRMHQQQPQGHLGHSTLQPGSTRHQTGTQAQIQQTSSHCSIKGDQQQQQRDGGPVQQPLQSGHVQLVCTPEQEAAYYDALTPPPAVEPHSIHCPVMMAVAAGSSTCTPAAALRTHEGVKAWVLQQGGSSSSGGSNSSKQLHGELRVYDIELAAAIPSAQLLEVKGVSHFGPLEQPQALADTCAAFFLGAQQQNSRL